MERIARLFGLVINVDVEEGKGFRRVPCIAAPPFACEAEGWRSSMGRRGPTILWCLHPKVAMNRRCSFHCRQLLFHWGEQIVRWRATRMVCMAKVPRCPFSASSLGQ